MSRSDPACAPFHRVLVLLLELLERGRNVLKGPLCGDVHGALWGCAGGGTAHPSFDCSSDGIARGGGTRVICGVGVGRAQLSLALVHAASPLAAVFPT